MPEPRSISELIDVRAEEAPGAIALAAPGRAPLSYGRLRQLVGETGAALRAAGIVQGDRVALIHSNGPELCAAFLSVASAAACAPLNPAYREAELEFYLADLQVRALVIEAGMRSPARKLADGRGIPVLEVMAHGSSEAGRFELRSLGGFRDTAEAPVLPPEVALALHTSGTTSRPKLVPITHANICASARNVVGTLELTPADRCLNVMPLFHVHGLVAAVAASLWAGGTVICSPGFDAKRFFMWLDELQPTWYTAVPAMHQAIVARADAHREVIGRRRLRLVRSSSAALPQRVLEELERTFGCPAIEAYGMTEAAHQMASNPLPPLPRKPGSVGLPAGVEVAILGESEGPLPQGAVGEIAVRGPNVFAGYAGNPAANREAFTGGWLRTGDEGSFDADGYLFLRGRLKEIINRGGEKVSPREIDEVLLDHPAVAQAVTFARPHERLGEDVAAAVVLRQGASATQRELQEFTASRLADFKVPSAVVFLDELPRGPTGKVQRIGLAERLGLEPQSSAPARGAYVPPRTPLERDLATLWEDVLGLYRIGIRDDFFDLGGDSILGAMLIARLVEVGLGPPGIPASTLLWAPTVERMAGVLEEQDWESPLGSLVPVTDGTGPPFYFVHGHDGDALGYARLARLLTADQPFYGVEARGVTEGEDPTVESLAHAYAAEIRAFQPAGPYFLGGRCMGGGIALEIARNLVAGGEQVALLVLVEPIGERRSTIRHYWRRLVSFHRRGMLVSAVVRFPVRQVHFARRRRQLIAQQTALAHTMSQATVSYSPRPYAGRITLARADYYMTPVSFWEKVALGGVDACPPVRVEKLGLSRSEIDAAYAEQLDQVLRAATRAETARSTCSDSSGLQTRRSGSHGSGRLERRGDPSRRDA